MGFSSLSRIWVIVGALTLGFVAPGIHNQTQWIILGVLAVANGLLGVAWLVQYWRTKREPSS